MIPVIVDDVKRLADFQMTRLLYFSIEAESPSAGWTLGLENARIPFHLIGLSGIITQPFGGAETFSSPEDITSLFELIEKYESLFVDINDIWLPNSLFTKSRAGKHLKRGSVFRVQDKIFTQALKFKEKAIGLDSFSFLDDERHINDKEDAPFIYFSEKETGVFAEWVANNINNAKRNYPKNETLRLWKHDNESRSGEFTTEGDER